MRLLSLLLACTEPDPGPAGPEDSAPVASPDWTGPPTLGAAEVAAEAQAALDVGLPDPDHLIYWLGWLFEQGIEGECPHMEGTYAMLSTFSGCLSGTGWFFAGLTLFETVEDGWELTGDGYAVDPQGEPFLLAGYVRSYRYEDGWAARYGGMWGYTGADGWVAAVPDLVLETSEEAGVVRLEGGYGPGDAAVYFDDVSVGETLGGRMGVRDPGGGWYWFEVGTDGCGEVDWYGEALGEACVDLRGAVEDLQARMAGS